MPKLTPLGPHRWKYQCECGREMEIETDASETEIKRASKCWECLEKDGFADTEVLGIGI